MLLTWAVLTGRVYVVAWPSPKAASRADASPAPEPYGRESEELPEGPQRTLSRRRSTLDEPEEETGGDAPSERGSILPTDLSGAAGQAFRDPKSKRLLLRDGAYWSEPDPYGFKVRGPSYLMDKVKVPCGPALFHLLDCDLFDIDEPQPHMARHLKDRMASLWAESGLLVEGKRPYTMIVQLQVPGPPYKSFCMYLGLPDRAAIFEADTPFGHVAKRFFEPITSPGGEGGGQFATNDKLHKWRNNTFKLIPRCVNAPFVVKRAVGEVPTLLGNKIQQFYFAPPDGDYFEVDCNIASSRIAQYTIGLAIDRASVVIADLAFLLQGGAPAELPEALIGAVRIEHIFMRDATKLDLSKSTSPP